MRSSVFFIQMFLAVVLTVSPVVAQEASENRPAKDPQVEFETMKAEWEKMRDQQIALIQEKEIQLEDLKEELFRRIEAAKKTGAVPPTGLVREESGSGPQAEISPAGSLEKKIAMLKEANRQLSDENSALRAENLRLEAAARAALSGSHSAVRDLLTKEREELDAQKAAFLKERQKFFREMNRQKEKLWAAQSVSTDEEAPPAENGSVGAGTI